MYKEILQSEFNLLKADLIEAYDQKGMRASGEFAKELEVVASDYSVILFGAEHSYYLEHGRKAGKFPPIDDIKKWIIDKGVFSSVLREISLSSLAFLIARKIAKEGWKRQGYGGVNLFSEVITEERIQSIIDKVGEVETLRISSEIINFINKLQST